jgi:D-tyrosyl-tRNA(Tyr) deacylase
VQLENSKRQTANVQPLPTLIALIQRVSQASVTIDSEVAGAIGAGVLVLLGVRRGDTAVEAEYLAGRVAALRIFDDEAGTMNLSLRDVAGEALVVSQFTLCADTRKGNRPSYIDAARPEESEPLYRAFIRHLESALGTPVATGRFGAMMDVALVNDGPVTIWLERDSIQRASS